MNFALLLLVPTSAALTPADAPAVTVTTWDAFVATEETPPAPELVVPAVHKAKAKPLDASAFDTRSIA